MTVKLNFELVRPLNSGGRGDVHLGYVREQSLWIAVKYPRDSHLPHLRQAFFREIDMLAKQVPGMVKLLGFNKQANPPFYVMEYLGGGTLTQYAGRLPEQQLLSLAAGLANVLAEFHSKCGAHGDYKPDNILATKDGKLKLGDPAGNGFGFSFLLAPARGGTPGYWAPEIRNNGAVSTQADVFSFGATLFHLVTGQRPVDSQNFDPLTYGFRCSPRLRDVILLSTQMNPKARPTMHQVVRMLGGESWESIRADVQRQVERQKSVVGLALAAGFVLALPFLFGD
ncbi:MAG: serine/threonine-protein kinase [Candidatus Acidiferrales bacterium]